MTLIIRILDYQLLKFFETVHKMMPSTVFKKGLGCEKAITDIPLAFYHPTLPGAMSEGSFLATISV